MDAREAALKALDALGSVAGALTSLGGPWGYGVKAVQALLRTAAKRMRESGEDVNEILRRIEPVRDLSLPWDEKTPAERPSRKRDGGT